MATPPRPIDYEPRGWRPAGTAGGAAEREHARRDKPPRMIVCINCGGGGKVWIGPWGDLNGIGCLWRVTCGSCRGTGVRRSLRRGEG